MGAHDGVLERQQRLRDPQPGQLRAQHVGFAVQQRPVPEQRQRVGHLAQRGAHPVRDAARGAGTEGDGGEHGVAQPAVPAVGGLVHQPGGLVEERGAGVQHGPAHPGVEVVRSGRDAVRDEGVPVRGRPADHGVHPQREPRVVQTPEPGRLPVPEGPHGHVQGDELPQGGRSAEQPAHHRAVTAAEQQPGPARGGAAVRAVRVPPERRVEDGGQRRTLPYEPGELVEHHGHGLLPGEGEQRVHGLRPVPQPPGFHAPGAAGQQIAETPQRLRLHRVVRAEEETAGLVGERPQQMRLALAQPPGDDAEPGPGPAVRREADERVPGRVAVEYGTRLGDARAARRPAGRSGWFVLDGGRVQARGGCVRRGPGRGACGWSAGRPRHVRGLLTPPLPAWQNPPHRSPRRPRRRAGPGAFPRGRAAGAMPPAGGCWARAVAVRSVAGGRWSADVVRARVTRCSPS